MIFNRGTFTEVWFKLESNEALGVLDTDYIEDYYGTDGQLTLVNTDTLVEYPILMNPSVDAQQGDILIGFKTLSGLQDGNYVLKGRVRDVLGNYTILTDYIVPDLLNTVAYELTISSSTTYSAEAVNGLTIMGGVTYRVLFDTPKDVAIKLHTDNEVSIPYNKDEYLYLNMYNINVFQSSLNIDEVIT